MGGECGREGVCRMEWNEGGKWDNCNSIIQKIYFFKKECIWQLSSINQQTVPVGKDVEKRESSCTVCGNEDWGSHYRKQYGVYSKNYKWRPWMVWLSGLSAGLQTKGLLVPFPVRAHAWVMGQVPSGRHVRGNYTLMFLSLAFSFPSPLSKNK